MALESIPDSFTTDRLLVRAPRGGDGVEVFAAIQESLENLRQWMEWAQQSVTLDEQEARVRRSRLDFRKHRNMLFYMYHQENEHLLGCLGLHLQSESVPSYEIGYWIRTSMQGKGYVTEAVNGLTDYAFNHFSAQRLEIHCDAENQRSAAVAERCAYTLEALLKHHRRNMQGELADTLIFVKFPDELR